MSWERTAVIDPGNLTFEDRIYLESDVALGSRRLFVYPSAGLRYGPDSIPDVGSWSSDELYDEDSDQWRPGRAHATCPRCGRGFRPMLARDRRVVEAGWRWVGLEYQEPFTEWMVRHGRCGALARYTIYSPQ